MLQYALAVLIMIFFKTELSSLVEFLKNFLFYLFVFILPIFLFIKVFFKENPFFYLELRFKPKAIITGIAIGIIMAFIFLITNRFKVNDLSNITSGLLMLTGGVLAGLFEEITFRGFYLKFLEGHLKFAWANIITSALFCALHFNQVAEHGMIQILMLFVMSLFLGYAYEKTKSVWTPVIIHIAYNILIFLFR